MNGESFVQLIKEEARDFSIDWSEGSQSDISNDAQVWLSNLSEVEQSFVREIVTEAIDNSLFQLLEIMDGVHTKNQSPIEASCCNEIISGKNQPQLHDLYASKI
ncbi:hypothetical protein [Photobacterium kasasachensis]|uniref:hypothetical protein n=1 Tax=Photobacterium kasasachensis TaxID=2910240 RepID=UPI003D0F3A13